MEACSNAPGIWRPAAATWWWTRVPAAITGAYLRLSRAIDVAVDRTRACDATDPGWRVMKVERRRSPEVVWPPLR